MRRHRLWASSVSLSLSITYLAGCGSNPSGTCGACTDSSQCCSPLSCVDGMCQAAIPR